MKTILSILILLISSNVNAQMVIGMGAGYNINSKTPAFNLQLGYTFGEIKEKTAFESDDLKQNRNHIYYCQTVSSKTKIMALHLGRNIKSFQAYIGYGYHLLSSDVKQGKEGGFKYDYGITFYPKPIPWLYVSAGRSGRLSNIVIGIYRVK